MRWLVVGDGRKHVDVAPDGGERGRKQDAVRLVDLTRAEGRPGPAQLGPGCEHGDARTSPTRDPVEPRSRDGPDLRSAKAPAASHNHIACPHVAATWANVVAKGNSIVDLHAVVMIDNILEGDDGICAVRHDASSCDPHRLPGPELAWSRHSRGDSRHDRQTPRRVGRPDRETVHRRARKGGQIDHSPDVLRDNAAEKVGGRHHFRLKGLRPFEHAGKRLFARQQLRRHGNTVSPRPFRTRAGRLNAVISVVVPVHDEERSVALLYDELCSALEPLNTSWEAIFVDDGSTDGTFAALTRLHSAEENVRVVRLRRNFGKAAALVAGFDQARGETVVTIDGDLQDDPAEIPRLLAKLDEGFDLVSGWKTRRRDPISRRILSRIFNRVTSAFSGVRLHDMNCGLKAYRAEVVHGLRLYGELHRFIPVLAHYRGFRIAELPVNHRPRGHGRSRYGLERYLRGFLDLLTVSFIGRYRHRPLHLFGGLGLALGAIGSAILVYLTVLKILGHAIGHRPLLMLGVLLVVIGMQFFSLGLISEMITSHHEERAPERERAELLVDEVLS
jgi:glycosyltransferase involved in cell wall biosynthesis